MRHSVSMSSNTAVAYKKIIRKCHLQKLANIMSWPEHDKCVHWYGCYHILFYIIYHYIYILLEPCYDSKATVHSRLPRHIWILFGWDGCAIWTVDGIALSPDPSPSLYPCRVPLYSKTRQEMKNVNIARGVAWYVMQLLEQTILTIFTWPYI